MRRSCNQVYSIASSELGRVVDGLFNDVGDVTSLGGKLGQTEGGKGRMDESGNRRPSRDHLRARPPISMGNLRLARVPRAFPVLEYRAWRG